MKVPSALVTWFGVGYWPQAPGTWGSLTAVIMAAIIYLVLGTIGLLVCTLITFLVGWIASNLYLRIKTASKEELQDPPEIVIDEVAGQWLTLTTIPFDPILYAAGFTLFRLFDITKPWPINILDKNIKGGLGVMLDDIGAALYAILFLQLLCYLMGKI